MPKEQTDLESERRAQAAWRFRADLNFAKDYDRLAVNEFLSRDEQTATIEQSLDEIVRFAARDVPFYQRRFAELGLNGSSGFGLAELRKFPVLTRHDVIDHFDALKPTTLPAGETIFGDASSSGTTGAAVKVTMSHYANALFSYMIQRQYRWFRCDPAGIMASIRMPFTLPKKPNGDTLGLHETFRFKAWQYVGKIFETGPMVCFSRNNSIIDQLQWLRQEQANYLVNFAGTLEEYAFASQVHPIPSSLRSVICISTELSPQMRANIEAGLAIPVDENYGLNEIGIVAIRCGAGRFHVNTEVCAVELVDDNNEPQVVGEYGRILVTGLHNRAMPLIRYDTDDTALVTAGACPCGRTSPSFGPIRGRFRRWAGLPEDSAEKFRTIVTAIRSLSLDVVRGLRRYQIHQREDLGIDVRMVIEGDLHAAVTASIVDAWQTRFPHEALPHFFRVESIDVNDVKSRDFTTELRGDASTNGERLSVER